MKTLKTIDELIQHMEQKGILFNIVNKADAKQFLISNNYYFKLAAYRENYEKKNGKYINLEFAYLKELSIIDMHLRHLILEMCLDLEHFIKLKLLNEIENNQNEDGYDIIRKFTNKYERACKNIANHKASTYCKELIDKYYSYFPAWVFVELISFGDLIKLYEYYEEQYPGTLQYIKLLYCVRDLRNATAHSNCLINKLQKSDAKPLTQVIQFVATINGIGRTMRQSKLSNYFLNDFVTLLFVYNELITSSTMKNNGISKLKSFFSGRAIEHKDYFVSNNCISTAYKFMKTIIDIL